MAKQTFTVGQVLTAAQLTSLQQTAMGGGAASAKTASYTLVAADAGTTISMTSTSATTITVNTGLFAAGDTVFIQNLGSGNCTVTAGTATVSTAGSAILPTNDAGILYFVSTGVAIFYDFIQTGAVSPLTTKGDLYGFSTLDARIPIGADNTVLTADSNETLGLKWATPAGGASTLVLVKAPTSFSNVANTGTTFDGVFTSTYKTYVIVIEDIFGATPADNLLFNFRYAGPTTQTSFYGNAIRNDYLATSYTNQVSSAADFFLHTNIGGTGFVSRGILTVQGVGAGAYGVIYGNVFSEDNSTGNMVQGAAENSRTYTGFLLKSSSSNITGTVAVYAYARS